MNSALYEVELAKTQIEHKDLIIVGFLILQWAKLPLIVFEAGTVPQLFDEILRCEQFRRVGNVH